MDSQIIRSNASVDRLEECLNSAKQSVKHEVRQESERRLQLHSQ